MSRAFRSVALLVVLLLAGCSATVAGQAVRTPRSAVEQALPDSSELGRVLGLPLESDSVPQVGGIGALRDDDDASSPMECAGVTHAGYRRTYQRAPVRAVALGSWTTPQGSDGPVFVAISVVELDSASSAQDWYARTAAQWGQCEGGTVTERTSAVSFIQNINRISDVDGTLEAELSVSTDNGIMTPGLNRHSFTATSQYLVDAEVFGTLRHLDASAVAHLVVRNITGG